AGRLVTLQSRVRCTSRVAAKAIDRLSACKGPSDWQCSAMASKKASTKGKRYTPEEKKKVESASSEISQQNENAAPAQEAEGGRIKASPLAKKMAADKGYNLSSIKGSGDGGRITKKDIDSYTPSAEPAKKQESESARKAVPFTAGMEEGHTDTDLTQMRKVIARRLGESKFSAPHFYLTIEINMDNAIKSREAMNEVSPVKISYNDMVIKACATALRLHPDVNSSWMGDYIRHNHHIHIGSAVALPEGLIVPVIKFADQKTLSQIAEEAKELYGKARNKKLQPQEFSGNTFSISNLGMMDIDEFTAIINPPDSCILAVGRIKEVVVRTKDGFD
ncbi:MAG: 2-oxo acid dehydrogenase subunit E2, partial [Proteobacteria bacterium]